MLQRLGLAGRLMLIVLCVLIVTGLSSIGFYWWGRGQDAGVGLRLPLPDQVAAIVDALDHAGDVRREIVLRAVNSEEMRVTVQRSRPALPASTRRMPAAEWLVGQYLEALPARDVTVAVLSDPSSSALGRLFDLASPVSRVPLQFVVPLTTGEFAVVQVRGAPTQRMFGLPTGWWVGVVGALLGAIAVWAIAREARPLNDLARSVENFTGDAPMVEVAPRGAPDLQLLIRAVNAMQARIATLLRGRTLLLGGISHDLKTYVTRLRLRVEDITDETQRDKAVADLDEMTALIDNALAAARGTGGVGDSHRVDIARLVSDMITARPAPQPVLSVTGPATVAGDAVSLRRVISNVIDNAQRYGRLVAVAVRQDAGRVVIDIDDDGPGIPAADREIVFEPFVRLDPSRNRDTGGSGLGLAIVRQIMAAHRGTAHIHDSPLGGTRVRLELPISEDRPS
jgi:two-component system, OmpR family, osmolarity sensor histidine kinase EnvZ